MLISSLILLLGSTVLSFIHLRAAFTEPLNRGTLFPGGGRLQMFNLAHMFLTLVALIGIGMSGGALWAVLAFAAHYVVTRVYLRRRFDIEVVILYRQLLKEFPEENPDHLASVHSFAFKSVSSRPYE